MGHLRFPAPFTWEYVMWGWLKRRIVRKSGQFRKSEGGATAVEFALVAGPFFYVLGVTCETGLMLFTEYVMQNSVQDAARLIRTGQASTSGGTATITADNFKTIICENVNIIIDCTNKVTVYVNSSTSFANLETAVPDPLTIGPINGNPYAVVYTPGGKNAAATVIATYDWDFVFPFMSIFGNVNNGDSRRLEAFAIFRNEPF
jgi:Flp pilus assembly protein TadG